MQDAICTLPPPLLPLPLPKVRRPIRLLIPLLRSWRGLRLVILLPRILRLRTYSCLRTHTRLRLRTIPPRLLPRISILHLWSRLRPTTILHSHLILLLHLRILHDERVHLLQVLLLLLLLRVLYLRLVLLLCLILLLRIRFGLYSLLLLLAFEYSLLHGHAVAPFPRSSLVALAGGDVAEHAWLFDGRLFVPV